MKIVIIKGIPKFKKSTILGGELTYCVVLEKQSANMLLGYEVVFDDVQFSEDDFMNLFEIMGYDFTWKCLSRVCNSIIPPVITDYIAFSEYSILKDIIIEFQKKRLYFSPTDAFYRSLILRAYGKNISIPSIYKKSKLFEKYCDMFNVQYRIKN